MITTNMRSYYSLKTLVSTLLLLFIASYASFGQNSLYVDQSVAADGDGLSWANAIKEFATALDSAWQNPNINTIYVAEWFYKPTTKPNVMNAFQKGHPITTFNSRNVAFREGFVEMN